MTHYLELNHTHEDIQNEPIFNRETGQYVVMSSGWQGVRRIHGSLLHLKIQEGKIWIERNETEYGIANALVEAGIPQDAIVLDFYSRAPILSPAHMQFRHLTMFAAWKSQGALDEFLSGTRLGRALATAGMCGWRFSAAGGTSARSTALRKAWVNKILPHPWSR